jgi:hypothetical protein
MNPQAYWKRFELAVFDRLRDHALRCPLCEGPGTCGEDGTTVLVSSDCQDGIVLLTEWFIAKHEAERERSRGVTPCRPSPS